MAVELIDNNAENNRGKSVFRRPGEMLIVNYDKNFRNESIDGENNRLSIEGGSFNSSTGYLVDVTGTVIFDSAVQAGSLNEVRIENNGPDAIFYGINSDTIPANPATEGTLLAASSSVQFDGPITHVWVASQATTGVVLVNGPYTVKV